jgi:hypothetical protein
MACPEWFEYPACCGFGVYCQCAYSVDRFAAGEAHVQVACNWDADVQTANALEMRLSKANGSAWVFPAQTKNGHIELRTLNKQPIKARRRVPR